MRIELARRVGALGGRVHGELCGAHEIRHVILLHHVLYYVQGRVIARLMVMFGYEVFALEYRRLI